MLVSIGGFDVANGSVDDSVLKDVNAFVCVFDDKDINDESSKGVVMAEDALCDVVINDVDEFNTILFTIVDNTSGKVGNPSIKGDAGSEIIVFTTVDVPILFSEVSLISVTVNVILLVFFDPDIQSPN